MPMLLKVMPHKLQDNLLAANLLHDDDDMEIIRAENTTRERNLKVFHFVFSRVHTKDDQLAVKDAISRSLCESSQYCPFSKKQEPASENQQQTLRNLRPRLVEDMEVVLVLDRLIQADIADQHVREQIEAEKTRRDRVNTLLMFISRTHSQAQETFMKILRDTNWWIFEDDTS